MCRQKNEIVRFLMELSKELSLQYSEQDWGFINADPQRLEEFISFFFHRVPRLEGDFKDSFIMEMTELIIESADPYFEGDARRPELDAEISRFWHSIRGSDAADYFLRDLRFKAGLDEPHGSRELLRFLESL